MTEQVANTEAKGRPYRSKKSRPCDLCRHRKACCVMQGSPPCMLCKKRGVKCTFTQKPPERSGKLSRSEIRFYVPKQAISTKQLPLHKVKQVEQKQIETSNRQETSKSIELTSLESSKDKILDNDTSALPFEMQDDVSQPTCETFGLDLPFTIDMWNLMFRDIADESIDPEITGHSWKQEGQEDSSKTQKGEEGSSTYHLRPHGTSRYDVCSVAEMENYISGSVDADEAIKVQYLSENSYMDPFLYRAIAHDSVTIVEHGRSPNAIPTSRMAGQLSKGGMLIRRLSGSEKETPSLLFVRSDPGLSHNDIKTKEQIRHLINNYGPRLLLIYFRFINPFLPLFSRSLFYFGTNQNMLEFHNSLLATLLTLAMDWWSVDSILKQHTMPSDQLLFKIARQAVMEDQDMPNYSSLQACILLSHKRPADLSKPDTPFTWMILSIAASLAVTLGYNRDCDDWNLPDWDKKLRKRIWWTYVVQDTWFAACYGRPLHIKTSSWKIPELTEDDYESYSTGERESVDFKYSVKSFCYLAKVSLLVADMCDNFLYAEEGIPHSFDTLFTIGKLYLHKVSLLGSLCPKDLFISSQVSSQLPRANGSVQISVEVARILIIRHLIHKIISSDAVTFEKYSGILIQWSIDCLRKIYLLVSTLRVDQVRYFWYSWSRLQFAVIANFFLLVHSLATKDEDRDKIRDLMDNFRWWLGCNKSSFADLSLALNLLDRAYFLGISKFTIKR